MKAYITKYALTEHGVFEIDADTDFGDQNIIYTGDSGLTYVYYHGEWCSTKEEAFEKANKMRNAKIASLKKQIEKLEKLNFDK